MKYRVTVGDACEECPRLSFAKLRAGELLIGEGDPVVIIERQDGRRYRASLTDDFDVKLTELFTDFVPTVQPAELEARRHVRYVALLEREERRRQRRRSEQEKRMEDAQKEKHSTRGQFRPVVCLDNLKPFASAAQAAKWLGITRYNTLTQSIGRGRMCGKLRWQYADVILKELENAKRIHAAGNVAGARRPVQPQAVSADDGALRAAAERALSLSKRKEV